MLLQSSHLRGTAPCTSSMQSMPLCQCRPIARPFSSPSAPSHEQQEGWSVQQSSRRAFTRAAASKGFGAKPDPSKLTGQTCPCGSKHLYRECCEQYHQGKAQPDTADGQLRARFCAFVKGDQEYLVRTFHPTYLAFKYPGQTPGGDDDPSAQLKRDVKMACTSYDYTGFKVLKVEQGATPDEAFVEFRYKSAQKSTDKRTNSRHTRHKAGPVDRNMDGSVKVSDTRERSRFLRDDQGWRFADYELLSFPEWMQEAKEAELISRQQKEQQQQEPTAGVAA